MSRMVERVAIAIEHGMANMIGKVKEYPMAKWEYRVIILGVDENESQIRLNSYGVNGWELVSIGGRFQEAQYAYLKRDTTGGIDAETAQRIVQVRR